MSATQFSSRHLAIASIVGAVPFALAPLAPACSDRRDLISATHAASGSEAATPPPSPAAPPSVSPTGPGVAAAPAAPPAPADGDDSIERLARVVAALPADQATLIFVGERPVVTTPAAVPAACLSVLRGLDGQPVAEVVSLTRCGEPLRRGIDRARWSMPITMRDRRGRAAAAQPVPVPPQPVPESAPTRDEQPPTTDPLSFETDQASPAAVFAGPTNLF